MEATKMFGEEKIPSLWSGKNPRQDLYHTLFKELVPSDGPAETIEGEVLRAFSALSYDAYNNGLWNNFSGALLYLKDKLPGFKEEWLTLIGTAIDEGVVTDNVLDGINEMGEFVITYVSENAEKRTPRDLAYGDLRVEKINPMSPAYR